MNRAASPRKNFQVTELALPIFNQETKSPLKEMKIFPCADSPMMANRCKASLDISRCKALEIAMLTAQVLQTGQYDTEHGKVVVWDLIEESLTNKKSIPPEIQFPSRPALQRFETEVQVRNESCLAAAWNLQEQGLHPLVLNFAHGLHAGGEFLRGAKAQEESLCRSSTLYSNLLGDLMYLHHLRRRDFAFSDWTILTPQVPVFRNDAGSCLDEPWLLDLLTCAAPIAHLVGPERAARLLEQRIHRILTVASAFEYKALVLGAWGCGNFSNDPTKTAKSFRNALVGKFAGTFQKIIFAIADWTPARNILGPFAEIFRETSRA